MTAYLLLAQTRGYWTWHSQAFSRQNCHTQLPQAESNANFEEAVLWRAPLEAYLVLAKWL